MSKPLVSVCIPTYNGDRYLREALDSVERQDYNNLEVIFSDDESSDNSLQIASDFKKRVRIPVYIYEHEPSIIGANWNNCILNSNGDYIKFLLQDDILESNCISRMVKMMQMDSQVGMVYCNRDFLADEKGKYDSWIHKYAELSEKWKKIRPVTGILDGKAYLKDPGLLEEPLNKVGEPTAVLLNKEVFKEQNAGLFSTELKQLLDIEYWWRVMKEYKIGYIEDSLVWFRLHDQQATQKNKYMDVDETFRLKRLLLKHLPYEINPKLSWKISKDFSLKTRLILFIKSLIG